MEPLLSAEDSEDNPAPPLRIHSRIQRGSRRRASEALRTFHALQWKRIIIWGTIWFLLHAVLAIFVWQYAQAEAYPLPRGFVNRSYSRLLAFAAFSYIFGIAAGFCDAVLFYNAIIRMRMRPRFAECTWVSVITTTIFGSICTIIAVFFSIAPLIFKDALSARAFSHACESDWMTVLISAHDYKHLSQPNRADFALSSSPNDVLFTFTSNDPDPSVFNLVGVKPAAAVLPTLSSVTYDFSGNTVTALCYGANSTAPCLAGTVDPNTYLTFDVFINNTRSVIRSVYDEWTLEDVPSVIMHEVDPATNALSERVLQTSVGACQRLKICVDHAVASDQLSPIVFIAVGWLLNQETMWAVDCTTPSTD